MTISITNKIYYIILTISLFVSLYFGIDSAGSGGFRTDFSTTWGLVEQPFRSDLTEYDIKFPLHYYIASFFYLILNDIDLLRVTYCIIGSSIPFIFYLCLKKKFINVNLNNLFLFSLIIFFMPSFRAAAIWPNTQITAIFFFLITIFFYLSWETKKQFNVINKELILTIIFMSLTVYTRQLYAMIFFYLLFEFYQKMNIKIFIKISMIIFILALPGFAFIYFWPKILQATFEFKLHNSLLVNSSIISFYLVPFFFIMKKASKISIIADRKDYCVLIILTIFVYICSVFFDYNFNMGGGFIIKLSLLLFNNLYLFFISSIFGFYLLYVLGKESLMNVLLILIILFSFSAYIIFQKYFEPMFILLLFFFFKTDLTKLFLDKKFNIYLLHIYFVIYLSSAIINDLFRLTKNL